jgi:hypothetical protein
MKCKECGKGFKNNEPIITGSKYGELYCCSCGKKRLDEKLSK